MRVRETKDYWEDCTVDKCDGGTSCLRDNGYNKHCTPCMCKVCTRGKCWTPEIMERHMQKEKEEFEEALNNEL